MRGNVKGLRPLDPRWGVTGSHIVAHLGALCMETELRRF